MSAHDPLGDLRALLDATAFSDTGMRAIGTERARVLHVASIDHDRSEHAHGDLVDAAICYLLGHGYAPKGSLSDVHVLWPWDAQDFKPGNTGNADADRLRDLTRAGQLIAAEITRLTVAPGALPLDA